MSFGQKIFKYIEKGNTKKVEQYIKNHKKINDTIIIKNEDALSKIDEEIIVFPLAYAIKENKLDIVKLFVKDSLKIPNFREQLSAAFALSMSVKNDTLSNYLFGLNPDLSAVCLTCHEQSALIIATLYANENWYFKLKPYSDLTATNHHGQNLMHIVLNHYDYSQIIFDDLLQIEQLQINAKDSFGLRPIDYAIRHNSNTAFYQLEKQLKARNISFKLSNYQAAVGGGLELFNYIEKDSNNIIYTVWTPIYSYYVETEDFNNPFAYLIEVAVDADSTNLVKLLFNRMLNDIINEKDSKLKEKKAGILASVLNSRYIDSDCTYRNYLIYSAILNKNKELFEFMISKSVEFNTYKFKCFHSNNIDRNLTVETAKVYFQKWDYKQAKKAFGKTFVDSLYTKLEISF